MKGKKLLICGFITIQFLTVSAVDITLVGYVRFYSGLGRLPVVHADTLKKLNVNFISTSRHNHYKDIPSHLEKIFKKEGNSFGNVILLDAPLSSLGSLEKQLPNDKIKIAYSMVESTKIPSHWTNILNSTFDAVVVPDKWLVSVYKDSGVKIPIFVIPIPLYLEDFLALPPRAKVSQRPFIFGMCAKLSKNKNGEVLLDAFAKEFGNNKNVFLKIHSPWKHHLSTIKEKIEHLKVSNILLITKNFSWPNYVKLMSTFDCYVLLSRGEGFSNTPREALAAGIPCIISNNTAHTTICETGYVRGVDAQIMVPHDGEFYDQSLGHNFKCKVEDVRKALRDVYTNYSAHLKKASGGREWVKRYLTQSLESEYLTLVRPQKVLLGNENRLEKGIVITNSKSLYEKYRKIFHL